MKVRYEKGNRKQRSALLSEMEQVTGLHHKSLTRLLGEESLERKIRVFQSALGALLEGESRRRAAFALAALPEKQQSGGE